MKKLTQFIEQYEKVITAFLTLILILITWRIGNVANDISKKQTDSIELQTEILAQQTKILQQQTDLQSYALDFDKDKFRVATYNQFKSEIDDLFEKITGADSLLTAVHNKVKNNKDVWDSSNTDNPRANLLKYIDEFEGIGALYCDGRIKGSDIRVVLIDPLQAVCNSMQISNYVQQTKSGLSAICQLTHPNSRMASWTKENGYKCPLLNSQ